MKTTNRASRKAGKKSTSAQSATVPKNSPGNAPAQELFLRIFTDDGNSVSTIVSELKLPPDLANYVVASVVLEKPNLNEFVIRALRAQIRRDDMGFSVPNLEHTIQQALLTIDSLTNKLLVAHENDIFPSSEEFKGAISNTICGYNSLALNVSKDLQNQFELICAYVQAGRAENNPAS